MGFPSIANLPRTRKKGADLKKGPGRFRTAKKGPDATGSDGKIRFLDAKIRFSDGFLNFQVSTIEKKGAGREKRYKPSKNLPHFHYLLGETEGAPCATQEGASISWSP